MKSKKTSTERSPSITMEAPSTEQKETVYVVIRDGYRVSDATYSSVDDPAAIAERDFWKRIATNYSSGEKVSIVKYDSKKHRVW